MKQRGKKLQHINKWPFVGMKSFSLLEHVKQVQQHSMHQLHLIHFFFFFSKKEKNRRYWDIDEKNK